MISWQFRNIQLRDTVSQLLSEEFKYQIIGHHVDHFNPGIEFQDRLKTTTLGSKKTSELNVPMGSNLRSAQLDPQPGDAPWDPNDPDNPKKGQLERRIDDMLHVTDDLSMIIEVEAAIPEAEYKQMLLAKGVKVPQYTAVPESFVDKDMDEAIDLLWQAIAPGESATPEQVARAEKLRAYIRTELPMKRQYGESLISQTGQNPLSRAEWLKKIVGPWIANGIPGLPKYVYAICPRCLATVDDCRCPEGPAKEPFYKNLCSICRGGKDNPDKHPRRGTEAYARLPDRDRHEFKQAVPGEVVLLKKPRHSIWVVGKGVFQLPAHKNGKLVALFGNDRRTLPGYVMVKDEVTGKLVPDELTTASRQDVESIVIDEISGLFGNSYYRDDLIRNVKKILHIPEDSKLGKLVFGPNNEHIQIYPFPGANQGERVAYALKDAKGNKVRGPAREKDPLGERHPYILIILGVVIKLASSDTGDKPTAANYRKIDPETGQPLLPKDQDTLFGYLGTLWDNSERYNLIERKPGTLSKTAIHPAGEVVWPYKQGPEGKWEQPKGSVRGTSDEDDELGPPPEQPDEDEADQNLKPEYVQIKRQEFLDKHELTDIWVMTTPLDGLSRVYGGLAKHPSGLITMPVFGSHREDFIRKLEREVFGIYPGFNICKTCEGLDQQKGESTAPAMADCKDCGGKGTVPVPKFPGAVGAYKQLLVRDNGNIEFLFSRPELADPIEFGFNPNVKGFGKLGKGHDYETEEDYKRAIADTTDPYDTAFQAELTKRPIINTGWEERGEQPEYGFVPPQTVKWPRTRANLDRAEQVYMALAKSETKATSEPETEIYQCPNSIHPDPEQKCRSGQVVSHFDPPKYHIGPNGEQIEDYEQKTCEECQGKGGKKIPVKRLSYGHLKAQAETAIKKVADDPLVISALNSFRLINWKELPKEYRLMKSQKCQLLIDLAHYVRLRNAINKNISLGKKAVDDSGIAFTSRFEIFIKLDKALGTGKDIPILDPADPKGEKRMPETMFSKAQTEQKGTDPCRCGSGQQYKDCCLQNDINAERQSIKASKWHSEAGVEKAQEQQLPQQPQPEQPAKEDPFSAEDFEDL